MTTSLPGALLRHCYRLDAKELRSWPLLCAILEKENLVVAIGSSATHLIYDFTDRSHRSLGLTTGAALHAEKQNYRSVQRTRAKQCVVLAKYWLRGW